MRSFCKETLFCILFVTGCPQTTAPIESPNDNSLFQNEPKPDGGNVTASSISDAGAVIDVNNGRDAGPSNTPSTIPDAGHVTDITNDAGTHPDTDPYTPCEGEWVIIENNTLVPVDEATGTI